MAISQDPNAPSTDDTLSTQPVKKPTAPTTPSALPIATQPAAPPVVAPPPATPATPAAPATPGAPAAAPPVSTTDPLAFAQPATPMAATNPAASALPVAPATPPAQSASVTGTLANPAPIPGSPNGIFADSPTSSTFKQQPGGVFDAGSNVTSAQTSGQVDAQGKQIIPEYLKGILSSTGQHATRQQIAGLMSHPEVLDQYTDAQLDDYLYGHAGPVQPPTGPANDAGTPSSQIADSIATANQNGGSSLPSSGGTSDPRVGAGVQTTPTTPQTALTNSTISVGPTVDRFKIARDQLAASRAASEPQYEHDLRTANENAFGAGRGVSGMLRTDRGNINDARESTLAKQESDLLNGALTGTINDAYNNAGIAQQQQGFEAGQQQTAFNQNYATQQLSDSERQQLFNEAMQQFYAGNTSDPAQYYVYLAGQYARPVGATA